MGIKRVIDADAEHILNENIKLKTRFKNASAQLQTDIQDISNLAEAKVVLEKMRKGLNVLFRVAFKMNDGDTD